MPVVYQGKAFREQHGISLRALARATGVRAATLVDLEKGRAGPHQVTLARIITDFQEQGIDCLVGNFLVYEPDPGPTGAPPGSPPRPL